MWKKEQRGVSRDLSAPRSPQFAPNFGGFAVRAAKAKCSCLTKDCMNSWKVV